LIYQKVPQYVSDRFCVGYKINKFKQPGTCYEIYGTNKEGKKVEVYFNPVDASIVKEEID
jgi:hypothetical protein